MRVDVGTGTRQSGDRVAIAAYLGSSDKFDTAVADLTETHADVTGRDRAAFVDAIAAPPVNTRWAAGRRRLPAPVASVLAPRFAPVCSSIDSGGRDPCGRRRPAPQAM
jgi:hypothetical protein